MVLTPGKHTLKAILLSLFIIIYLGSHCQTKAGQQAQIVGYNIGFGIVTTTVGSLINKPKHAPVWPYIKKSLWQGALGGALQYSGKALTYQITRSGNEWWGWGSKIVHSAGTSICHNASMNYRFGQYWVLDYGPARLNFTFNRGSLNFRPQLNLLFLCDLGYCLNEGGKLDWGQTARLGTFTFRTNKNLHTETGAEVAGRTITHSILLVGNYDPVVPGHELVHIYQSNEYRVMNTYFNPLVAKINNKIVKGIFKYVYVEPPYFNIVNSITYNPRQYYRNYYEFEAASLSTNAYVDRDQRY